MIAESQDHIFLKHWLSACSILQIMDVTICCLSRGTAPNVQLCLLKWAFILCWGPRSISRDVLGEFFSCVDYLSCLQVSKIRLSWSKFSRNSFYTRRESGNCSQPDCFFHYSSHYGMMGDHTAIELQWLKQAPSFPILQVSLLLNVSLIWHCDLDTWVGFFKCLVFTSRTSQTSLNQDCLLISE